MSPRPLAAIALLLALGGCAPDRNELVGQLSRLKDQLCACKDRGCAAQTTAAIVDWSLQHAEEMAAVKAGDDGRAIVAELTRCQDRLRQLQ